MKLVICEKPSVGAAVAAALGVTGKKDGYIENDKYIISWCIGHLVQLSEAAAYGEQYRKWSYDSLPILPQEWQYTVAADKGKQFKILKDLMHRADVSEVVNACDAGREGELIFRFVYHQAGCKKPRYQCDPPFLLPVWKDLERGTCADPDLKNACRPGRCHYKLQERNLLSCAPYAPRRRSGKREDLRR